MLPDGAVCTGLVLLPVSVFRACISVLARKRDRHLVTLPMQPLARCTFSFRVANLPYTAVISALSHLWNLNEVKSGVCVNETVNPLAFKRLPYFAPGDM